MGEDFEASTGSLQCALSRALAGARGKGYPVRLRSRGSSYEHQRSGRALIVRGSLTLDRFVAMLLPSMRRRVEINGFPLCAPTSSRAGTSRPLLVQPWVERCEPKGNLNGLLARLDKTSWTEMAPEKDSQVRKSGLPGLALRLEPTTKVVATRNASPLDGRRPSVRPALGKRVEAGAEDDILREAVAGLFDDQVLDEASAGRDPCSEAAGGLWIHVGTVAPAIVRGRRLQAELVFEDVWRRIDLDVQRPPQGDSHRRAVWGHGWVSGIMLSPLSSRVKTQSRRCWLNRLLIRFAYDSKGMASSQAI